MTNFWQAVKDYQEPIIGQPLEYRLYYDSQGHPILYTTQELSGNYLVIDVMTYACARLDVKIHNGKIYPLHVRSQTYKLVPSAQGQSTEVDNILIINENSPNKWQIKYYETN